MKSIILLFSLIFMATSTFAATTSGDLSVGGSFVDGNGADKSAKFLEYRDIDNQLTTDLNLRLVNGALYLGAEGKNLGYDDQEVSLKGGMFGKGKFSLWYDELTHNYSLDDRTIYAGVGTTTLTLTPGVTPTDVTTWQPLDYAVDRQQVGAKLELTFDTPFFVTFNVNQTEKDGEYPISIERDRKVHELPMPIDYKTTNLSVKAGYRTKVMFAQVDASLSKFENTNSLIAGWYSPTYNPLSASSGDRIATETFTLAPDNDMWQIGGQFVLRDLPLNSVLAVRGSYAVMESDPVLTTADSFDGELTYSKAAVTLKSRPTAKLDTEITYSFLQKDNKAARFHYEGPITTSTTDDADTHIFEYNKHHAGLSAAYRVNSSNRVKAGYDFLKIDRADEMRHDAEETEEQTVFVEWKNTTFEMFTPKVRYEHMVRTSDFNGASLCVFRRNPATDSAAKWATRSGANWARHSAVIWATDSDPKWATFSL